MVSGVWYWSWKFYTFCKSHKVFLSPTACLQISKQFHQLSQRIPNEKLQYFHLQILTFFLQYRDKEGFTKPVSTSTEAILILNMCFGYVWKNEQAESYWHDLKVAQSKILPVERRRNRGGSWTLPMMIFPPSDKSKYLSTYWLGKDQGIMI